MSPAVSEGSPPSSNSSLDTGWDPDSWEPTVHITPIEMSAAERAQWRLDYLVGKAHELGIAAPPDVALVRWTVAGADASEAMATCLSESGFPAEPSHDGGVGFGWELAQPVPQAQQAPYDLAVFTCTAEFTIEPRYLQEWTSDQLGLLYDYWVQYYGPCMAAQGFPVSDAQRPSRAVWISTFHTSDRSAWFPPDRLGGAIDPGLREQIAQLCPSYPPAEAFYGA